MNFLIGYHTDKGIKKDVNQDSLVIKTAKSPYGRIGLFVICDGMGGLSQGELASATVARGFSNWFDNEVEKLDFNILNEDEVYNIINKLVKDLNSKIMQYGKNISSPLGTTITMMLTVDNKYYLCQIGDSRAYKVTERIELLTKDQTLVAREIEKGNLTEEEAKVDKRRNILIQCIGAKKDIKPVFSSGIIDGGENFIICSDGFYRKLNSDDILDSLNKDTITTSEQLSNISKDLVEEIMKRKEIDNISTIIIKTIL